MRKIPTVFVRDPETNLKHVRNEVNPGCEWVLAGEGVATRKYDGTCVRIHHVYVDGPQVAVDVRREVKPGKEPPEHFEAVETDENTGKTVGWEPYSQSGFSKFIDEAIGSPEVEDWPEGTYELVGPKIQGNPERFTYHVLIRHASAERYPALNTPQGFDELAAALASLPWEGIVWHHPDGRMAKLKRKDFAPVSVEETPQP